MSVERNPSSPGLPAEAITAIADAHPTLAVLVLHGSRARGDAHARSDWDFGFLGQGVDPLALRANLTQLVQSDEVDLTDLSRAGALLAYRVARDGVLLFEREPERFTAFRIAATLTWLDMEPVVSAAHREILAELGP